jgi:succinate dehydrogenase hydrophobic anchor subunit
VSLYLEQTPLNIFNTADSGSTGTKVHHLANLLLLGLFPVAVLSDNSSMIALPIDLALGFLVPIHAHIGINYVISDYVPKAMRSTNIYIVINCNLYLFVLQLPPAQA